MSDLTFSQPERRNFLVPILIAVVIIGGIFGYIYLTPHRIADITVTKTAVLPTHTEFKTDSKLVGAGVEAQDAFYVLATIRIDNRLKVPLTIDDMTGTITQPDDTVATVTAIQKSDLDSVTMAFPALKPLAGPPLLRETSIQPGDHAEGMVLLNLPITEAQWKDRKSATITLNFYHQDPLTITLPKEQGTGNSK
jgi:hypothetical protein